MTDWIVLGLASVFLALSLVLVMRFWIELKQSRLILSRRLKIHFVFRSIVAGVIAYALAIIVLRHFFATSAYLPQAIIAITLAGAAGQLNLELRAVRKLAQQRRQGQK